MGWLLIAGTGLWARKRSVAAHESPETHWSLISPSRFAAVN
jgi:hypothetical protein